MDLLIIETGVGGDLVQRGNDIATVAAYENSPYLAMFGGDDWWGNFMIPNNPFQSQTEDVLNTTPLNSSGRLRIEDAANADLSYLNNIPGTTWKVVTTITAPDRVKINIDINGQQFDLGWNPDKLFLTYEVK